MFSELADWSESLERLSETPYAQVFEWLHTGIALVSASGHFLYANKAFQQMFALPKQLRRRHVAEFFLTAEQGCMETIRTGKITICSSLTTTNAQGISFRYPILDEKGKLQGVIIESISASIENDKLLKLLDTVRNLEEKAHYFEQAVHKKPGVLYSFDSIIGESEAVRAMKKLGQRFARSHEPILVVGESGTGKELVAQALHSASPRSGNPFVTVNCAALPPELMESELFGYDSGAFTGAKTGGMKGKFELAHTGTIFLDEIGELPLPMQAKLLRVLETGEIQKIGHSGRLHADFRLIAATNKDLGRYVTEGLFREDLYHRLNILELVIPPLRERLTDIPLLVRCFIEKNVGTKRAQEIQLSNELYRALRLYPWRGNVRELRNVMTYVLFALGDAEDILTTDHLPERFVREMQVRQTVEDEEPAATPQHDLKAATKEAERKTLLSVLENTKYNKTLAAQILGISRNKLYKKINELGL